VNLRQGLPAPLLRQTPSEKQKGILIILI